ncbi:NAD(P)-binding protein [Westerdykella ornata]|uniref:NAD(P)-binding protein n=1 Tax=Westerdykella ornata TaxID=318751 RepID=A0A6A6JFN7_WESOR|nr:NAD(P)-binding protein [Westerdykella ornata]KAF2275232.1 NAD(P)-binding protein [Westerdykella ornata]
MSIPSSARTASTNLLWGPTGHRVLEGRLAIVTGASRGIGAAVARNLASKGCNLVLNYTSDSSTKLAEQLAQDLRSEHGIKAVTVQASMGSEEGPKYIVEVAKNHFQHPKSGNFQIDIIINNAGVARNDTLETVSAQEFARQFNVNVRGPLLLVQAALPYLPHDRSGRIVNVSSVSSSLGYISQSIYGGTKAALEAMTRTWARELAERATVNAINPGPVTTDMYLSTDDKFTAQNKPHIENTPLARPRQGIDPPEIYEPAMKAGGRPAYSEEIAGVVGMLCTPEAGWTTGSVVCANGGMKFTV